MNEEEVIAEAEKVSLEIQQRVLEAIGNTEKVTNVIVALSNIIVMAISFEKSEKGKSAAAEYLMQIAAYAAKDAGIKQYGLFNIIEQAYQDNGESNV